MMRAVILVGPPGSGKTTIATALSDELRRRGRAHGLVELDALGQAHPPLPAGVAIAHLEAIAGELRAHRRDLVVVTATPETPAEMDSIRTAAGGDLVIVALDAPLAALRRRLLDREPEPWPAILIPVAERVHAGLAEIAGPDATVIDTEASTEPEAVGRILDRLV